MTFNYFLTTKRKSFWSVGCPSHFVCSKLSTYGNLFVTLCQLNCRCLSQRMTKKWKLKFWKRASTPGDKVINSMFNEPEADEKNIPESYAHKRLVRINQFLKSKRSQVYCRFLLWFLPSVDNLNKTFQKDEDIIHLANRLLHNFLRDLLLRFVKASTLIWKNRLQKSSSATISKWTFYWGEY